MPPWRRARPGRMQRHHCTVLCFLVLLLDPGWLVRSSNVLGRVQQLEVELQAELHKQLEGKLRVALDSSSNFPPEDEAADADGAALPAGVRAVARTGLIVAPLGGWTVLEEAEKKAGEAAQISEASPLCVFAPLRRKAQLQELQGAGGVVSPHAMVSSRLLHSARMVRLARDLTRQKLGLPASWHKRSPPKPDTRPVLVHLFVPDEFEDTLCLVLHDTLQEYTFRGRCTPYSRAHAAQQRQVCGVAVWGSSKRDKHRGSRVAASVATFPLAVEVDLDAGDSKPPESFAPSFSPGVYGDLEEPEEGKGAPAQAGEAEGGPLTLVTAFSKNHYTVGVRLMNGLLVQGKKGMLLGKPPFSLVVWTMETFDANSAEKVACVARAMRLAGISVVVRSFDFFKYPLWTYVRHYKAGWWAWKAIMVWETYVHRGGSVLWMDAGNLPTSPDAIPGTFANLHKQGFVGVTSGWFGMNYRWTHPGTITFLGVDLGSDTTQCCGCLFGVTRRVYEEVLRPMFECSLTLQCLAPAGSDMGNHRQDQSVLSVLAWHHGLQCTGAHEELLWKCDSSRHHCSKPPEGGAVDICAIK